MQKITNFKHADEDQTVEYIETQVVKDGVECDVYRFPNDTTKDLAIVRVKAGHKTPKQLILKGTKTIEGHISGQAILFVTADGSDPLEYIFPNTDQTYVELNINSVMQWQALEDLTFYEICEPPYEDGRFKVVDERSVTT